MPHNAGDSTARCPVPVNRQDGDIGGVGALGGTSAACLPRHPLPMEAQEHRRPGCVTAHQMLVQHGLKQGMEERCDAEG